VCVIIKHISIYIMESKKGRIESKGKNIWRNNGQNLSKSDLQKKKKNKQKP